MTYALVVDDLNDDSGLALGGALVKENETADFDEPAGMRSEYDNPRNP